MQGRFHLAVCAEGYVNHWDSFAASIAASRPSASSSAIDCHKYFLIMYFFSASLRGSGATVYCARRLEIAFFTHPSWPPYASETTLEFNSSSLGSLSSTGAATSSMLFAAALRHASCVSIGALSQ